MSEKSVKIFMHAENANDSGAVLVEWKKTVNTYVKKGEVIAVFETTKAAFDIEAPADGFLQSKLIVGDFVEQEEEICELTLEKTILKPVSEKAQFKITKKAQNLIDEYNLNVELLPENIEIVREKDVKTYLMRQQHLMKDENKTYAPLEIDSQNLIQLREQLSTLRLNLKNESDRHVPLGTLLNSRWGMAEEWKFGKGASVYDECLILGDVTVGENCWIGPFTVLDGSGGKLEIGDWTSIGTGSHIYTHDTINRALSGGRKEKFTSKTKIGKCCFISPQVIVAPGSEINDYTFVIGHSFIEGRFPSNTILGGVPAKVIGEVVFENDQIKKKFF